MAPRGVAIASWGVTGWSGGGGRRGVPCGAGTPPGAHITTHELGHAMDALLDLRRQPELLDVWRSRVSKFTRAEAADQLSIYGTTNVAEMIAEAWTEYRHAAAPRPLAREIGQIIEQKYRASFPV